MDRSNIVIIRSSGERTAGLCKKLAQMQSGDVHVINESPFYNALKKQAGLAINSGKKWLITIDADELIMPEAISNLIDFAESFGDEFFTGYGLMDCKFTLVRGGNPRIYRIKYLKEAMNYIENVMRPEQDMCLGMVAKGYLQKGMDSVTAYHDREQYYRDIYRKCFVHVKKHPAMINIKKWHEQARTDNDFKVAFLGYEAGRKYNGRITADINSSYSQVDISSFGIKEKGELLIRREINKYI